MKKIFLSFTFLSLVFLSFAQEPTGPVKKAEKDYDGFSYSNAIIRYVALNDSTINIRRKVASSYSKIGKTASAEVLYKTIVNDPKSTPDDLYNYASVLRQNKKYSESDIWMSKYYQVAKNDSRAIAYSKNLGAYKELLKDKKQFSINNLEINSAQEDFSPVYFNEKVLFASSREGVKSIRREWNRNQLPFLDIYQATITDSNQLVMAEPFNKKFNKKFHEGPVCFNSDQTKLAFTRNNYKSKSSDGLIKLQLYFSDLEDGKWSSPEAFVYNSNEYSVGHAAYSADGKWLYFASDMPGGIGGVDLYKVAVIGEGFGEPINLGDKINTEGNELFPTIHENGILFFASNGLVGLGGLDIFAIQIIENDEIGKPMNLGAPINSNRDDLSLTLDKGSKKGYFASNRDGGKGDDDIYYFDLLKPITFGRLIKGVIKDKEGNLIAFTKLTLLDLNLARIGYMESTEEGEFEFFVSEGDSFTLLVEKDDFSTRQEIIVVGKNEEFEFVEIELEKEPDLSLYALVKDKKTGLPIEGVSLKIKDNMTGMVDEFITSSKGDFLKDLVGKKLNDTASYKITMQKKGYLTKTGIYNSIFDKEGRYDIHEKLDLSLESEKIGNESSQSIDEKLVVIKGIVRYESGKGIAFQRLDLLDLKLREIAFMQTDAFGEFEFFAPEGDSFTLTGETKKNESFKKEVVKNADGSFSYVLIIIKEESGLSLYGLVKDEKNGLPVEGVILKIKDNITGLEEQFITSKQGDFLKELVEKKLDDTASYQVTLQKQGYITKTGIYNDVFDRNGRYDIHEKLDLSLTSIEVDSDVSQAENNKADAIKGIVRYEDGSVYAFRHLELLDFNLKKIAYMQTDAFGEFEFFAPKGDDFTVAVETDAKGIITKKVVRNADGSFSYVEIEVPLGSDGEPVVDQDLITGLEINPIYFDFDKSNIRSDAAIELNKIVKVMNANPTMVIQLGSHTDSRGSGAYNLSLSERRAKSSIAYVRERITNPERIYGKGFGESDPNSVDALIDGGSKNQTLNNNFIYSFRATNRKLYDKYHQFNRRTEFLIIKM